MVSIELWVTTVYLLTSTVAVPVFAKISDLYGRKWLYLSGAVLFIIASVVRASQPAAPPTA